MGFSPAWLRGRRVWAAVLGGCLCAVVAPASGQEPAPQQTPTFRTGVNLVRVDVSVIGRDGQAISDLQPADFEIQEDGVPQTAETVQFLRLDGQQTPGSNESLDIRSQDHARLEATRENVRIFAIFFDEYHIDKAPAITLPMREALEAFVEMLGPSDLVAIMDPLTPLSALKFTRNRRELLDQVKKFEGRRGVYIPARSILEEAQLTQRNVAELRAGVSLSALNALVTYLGGLREGRKSVLFVSQGPPVNPLGNGLKERLDEALQSANRSNVTINVFDPRALGSAPFGGADSLFQMANDTGGRRIVNTNSPEKDLAHVVEAASAYYLVGYTPTRDFADGKFHKVEVRVKRRGARVESRRGYWAPKAAELTLAPEPAPEEPGLRESLETFSTPVAGQPVALWVGMSRGDAGRTRVTVSWDPSGRVAATGIQDHDRPRAVRLDIEPKSGSGTTLAEMRGIATGLLTTDTPTTAAFDLEPGDVTLHLEARGPEGDTVDRWTNAITVPDLNAAPVTLSTPRFLRARSAFELKVLQSTPTPPPVALRDFRRTDRVFVEVDCYRTGTAAPEITAELLNSSGKVLASFPVRSSSVGVSSLTENSGRVEVPMANLAIGRYVLRLKASAGDERAQQLAAFRVVP